jgi:FAD/FMN-containing dehydrogenase
MYGHSGLLQFQCWLPFLTASDSLSEMLDSIRRSEMASFLSVLKVCGEISSPGIMSFPKRGITLALDFPIRGDKTFRLVDELGKATASAGGRLYPAKDARMTSAQFRQFYPQWESFSQYVDPQISSSFWRRVRSA